MVRSAWGKIRSQGGAPRDGERSAPMTPQSRYFAACLKAFETPPHQAARADDGTRTRDPHLGKVRPHSAGIRCNRWSRSPRGMFTTGDRWNAGVRCVGVAGGVPAVLLPRWPADAHQPKELMRAGAIRADPCASRPIVTRRYVLALWAAVTHASTAKSRHVPGTPLRSCSGHVSSWWRSSSPWLLAISRGR
jgi:hypothetical protein